MPESATQPAADPLRSWQQTGDAEAFRSLVQQHQGMVALTCRRRLGDGADADDAAQATFILLARHGRRIRDGARLGPWLHTTAMRACSNVQRAAERRRRHESAAPPPVSPDTGWNEVRPHLDAAIAALSSGQRAAVVSFYLLDKPQATIAVELGCSVAAVKMRLQSALEHLHELLRQRGITLTLAGLTAGLAAESAAAEHMVLAAPSDAARHLAKSIQRPGSVATMLWACLVAITLAIACIVEWPAKAAAPMVNLNNPPPLEKPAPPPSCEEILASVHPFRFYGDNLTHAVVEVFRRLPKDAPLRCSIFSGYENTSVTPRRGTDQLGLLHWRPTNGTCSVREVFEHLAWAFEVNLIIAGDTALFYRALTDQEFMTLSGPIFQDAARDDAVRWATLLSDALSDATLAERLIYPRCTLPDMNSNAYEPTRWPRFKQGDYLTAGLGADPQYVERARKSLTGALTHNQAAIAIRLLAIQPRLGDDVLVFRTLSNILGEAPIPADHSEHELLNTGVDFLAHNGSLDSAVISWLKNIDVLFRTRKRTNPRDYPFTRPSSLTDALVVCDAQDLAAQRALAETESDRIWLHSLLSRDPQTNRQLKHIHATTKSAPIRTAATRSLLRRGDHEAVTWAIAEIRDGNIDIKDRYELLNEVAYAAQPVDVSLLAESIRDKLPELVASDDYRIDTALQLFCRPALNGWKELLAMFDDERISNEMAMWLVIGIDSARDDEADQLLRKKLGSAKKEWQNLLDTYSSRKTPMLDNTSDRVAKAIAAANPQNAVQIACNGILDGDVPTREMMRSMYKDTHQLPWLRGAALLALCDSGNPVTGEDLASAASDADGYIRAIAYWGIMICSDKVSGDALPTLISRGLLDSDPQVRAYATYAGRHQITPSALIEQLVSDPSPLARRAAASALVMSGAIAEGSGQDAMQAAAKNDIDPEIQKHCAWLLKHNVSGMEWEGGDVGTRNSGGESWMTLDPDGKGELKALQRSSEKIVITPPVWSDMPNPRPLSTD